MLKHRGVFKKNKETNVPEVCIELSPDRKALVQAKDYCNDVVKPEKRDELIAFLRANKIEFSHCYDANCLHGVNVDEKLFSHTDIDGYSVFDSKEQFCFKRVKLNNCFEGISLNVSEDFLTNVMPFAPNF